jgi:hypothetical protein
VQKQALWFALLLVGMFALNASGAIVGSFRHIGSSAPILEGFDIWVFELQSNDLDYDTFSLRFESGATTFLNTMAPTAFRDTPTNPVVFGFQAPETFFVTPPNATVLDIGTVDTSTTLASDYTIAGGIASVPNNADKVPIAFFSVPFGTLLGPTNFISGLAVSRGSPIHTIAYGELVPEPATFAIALLISAVLFTTSRTARIGKNRRFFKVEAV